MGISNRLQRNANFISEHWRHIRSCITLETAKSFAHAIVSSQLDLLSLELFILGVQANKLHFCNLELILNQTGYSHIIENKHFFFIF